MELQKIEVDRSKQYSELIDLMIELKKERLNIYQKIKDKLETQKSDRQLFELYCRKKISEILPDKKTAVN